MTTKYFMNKLLAVGAILALGLGFATGVQAVTFIIDDFNTLQPPPDPPELSCTDTTVDGTSEICPAPLSGDNIAMQFAPGTPGIAAGWERTLSADLAGGDDVEAVVCDNCQAGHHDAGPGGSIGVTDFSYVGPAIDLTGAKSLHFDYAADQDDAVVQITFSDDGGSSVVVDSNLDPNFPAGLPNTHNSDNINDPANRTPVEIPLPSDPVFSGVVSIVVEILGVTNLQLTIDDIQIPHVEPGHFLCYKSFGHFLREEVNLVDQFDDVNFKVLKPKMFCNPGIKRVVDSDFESDKGIKNIDAHLLSYKIKKAHREPRHERRTVTMKNQFGDLVVQTFRPDRLMVPSGKLVLDDLTPDDQVPAIPGGFNHFKCYKVRTVGDFEQKAVNVFDQFTDPDLDLRNPLADDVNPVGKDLVLVRPTRMCTPVQKTRDGITTEIKVNPDNPLDHLMCYSVKAGIGARLNKRTEVRSNNQFRPEDLVLKRELELCVPSAKTVQ